MRGRPSRSIDILAPGENSITTINHNKADTFISLSIDKKKQLSNILKDPKIPKKSLNIKIDRNKKKFSSSYLQNITKLNYFLSF